MRTTNDLIPVFLCWFLIALSASAKSPEKVGFDQVYGLIRTNLTGLAADEFEKEALRGLLRRFQGDVQLLRKKQKTDTYTGELVSEPKVLDTGYGYVRVRHVGAGLAEAVRVGVDSFDSPLVGLLVDLRFAGGGDYEAAVEAANVFIDNERSQVQVGSRHLRTQLNTNAVDTPITILVNERTVGAAEVLASVMRDNGVGLLVGKQTAGSMKVFSEFKLDGGSRLRVATDRVRLDNGDELPRLEPDVAVRVSLESERRFFGDDVVISRKRSSKKELNEAELVRRLKLRNNPEAEIDAVETLEEPAELADPVMARALGLLKGLRLLRSADQGDADEGKKVDAR